MYPDGEAVNTTYNLRGLPTAVAGQSAYLTGATYNALGQPLRQAWGNTRSTTYTYHPQNLRLTQLAVSGNLLDLRYGYDRVGNITAITDTVNSNQVQTFGYDVRDRLAWARTNAAGNGQYHEAYGYDRMGNIITRTVGGAAQAYTYACPPPSIASTLPPTLPQRVYFPLVMRGYGPESPPLAACVAPFAVVSTTAGFRAAYDPNGNMILRVEVSGTQRITYTQEYNAENRLTVVTNTVSGQVTRFVYDGDGNRVLRIDGSGTQVAIGDYYEQTGGTVRKYYYAGGQRIAMRQGGALTYLHGDHLGSATVATDANGNRIGELRYTPYGVTRYEWGSTPTNRRYTGQPWEGVGLYDYGARMYSPSLARWVSADMIVPEPDNPQSLNRFAYAYNNSVCYTDPTGHYVCSGYHEDWGEADCYDVIDRWLGLLEERGGEIGVELVNRFWETDRFWPIYIRFVDELGAWAQTDTRFGREIRIRTDGSFVGELESQLLNSAMFGHELHHLVNQRNAYVIASAWGEKQAYDVTWQLMESMGLNPEEMAQDWLRDIHLATYSDEDLHRIQRILGTQFLRPAREGEPFFKYWGRRVQGGVYTVSMAIGLASDMMGLTRPYVYYNFRYVPGGNHRRE